jgi:asparagine synthase (glutamine-hydrolysing)
MLLFSGECFSSTSGSVSPQMDAGSFAASVIEGCREEGESHLRRLNGLFSGLIIDRVLNSCLLFNDRFGMERLYWHESAGAVLVSSEAKAILRVAQATRSFHREGVAQYLKFGSIAGSHTLFKGITRLPGATAIQVSAGSVTARGRYFDPGEWEGRPAMTAAQYTEALTDTMRSTVPEYLTGQQGIAFSITGGLDTRMILAGMPVDGPTVHCYTFGGLSGETLDQSIGARLAAMCGLTHVSLRVDQRWLETFAKQVDRTVWATDGTAGATTAHEIWLTEQGRALGTVRLTGNFGSEVLRSMSTLKAWTPPVGFLARGFLSDFEACPQAAVSEHPVTRAAFHEIPCHLYGSFAAGRSQVTFRTPYLDNALVELAYSAPAAARHSPAPSMSVVQRLRPELATIPTDRGVRGRSRRAGSHVHRAWESLRFKLDYLDKEGLPGSLRALDPILQGLHHTPLLGRHKYLPYRKWFQKELVAYVTGEAVAAQSLGEFLNADSVTRIAEQHASGRKNRLRELNMVLTLSAMQRIIWQPPPTT